MIRLEEGRRRPILKPISKILFLFAKEAKDRSPTATFVYLGLLIFIIVLYYICSIKKFADSGFWPERIKIRNKNAARPDEEISDQVTNGMKKRRLFYQDIDQVKSPRPHLIWGRQSLPILYSMQETEGAWKPDH